MEGKVCHVLWAYRQSKVNKMWEFLGLNYKHIANTTVQIFRALQWIDTLYNLFSVVFSIHHRATLIVLQTLGDKYRGHHMTLVAT